MLPLLIPILTQLASKGLDLIGSAVLAKGKDVVEKELGVNIEESLQTEEGTEALKLAQLTHEEKLLELALEDKKLDLDYYKTDAEDRSDARAREVSVLQAPEAGWLNHHLLAILALIVIIGGGYILYTSTDTDIKFTCSNLMMMVLGYFFGSSKSSASKDAAISNLSKGQ